MEEIDKKSIQAVQAAISFLIHVGNGHNSGQELKKEEIQDLIKDLEDVKLKLEAKDLAYERTLIKLDNHKRAADELSNLLKKSDSKKQFYIDECRESGARVSELEAAVKQMTHQVLESEKVQEQLSCTVTDLASAQAQLLNMEAEITVMREARAMAVSQFESMETALNEEKQKTEVLTRQALETDIIIANLKKRVLEIEREKASAIESTECMKIQLERMHDLENQLESNEAIISSLQREINQAKEMHALSQKSVSNAAYELKKLEEDLELQEKKNSDQEEKIRMLEAEIKQSRAEMNRFGRHLEDTKFELEKEQVEVALLKFELHKGKSKLAAAEAKKLALNSENRVENSRNEYEVENMKKDLEAAMLKIGQLRTRAAQAIGRAEAAEKAKSAMEDRLKQSNNYNNIVAVKEESISWDDGAKAYRQPLVKVLDMKF